jgi:hypothetical protein
MAEATKLGKLTKHVLVSRGEEGSKFNVKVDKAGEFNMVIPRDVERYWVGPGVRVNADSLTASKARLIYGHPKIWCVRIQKMRWKQRLVCGYDARGSSAGMKTLQAIVSPRDSKAALECLQGVLASRLMNFWCINFLSDDMNQTYLEALPIPSIVYDRKADAGRHDKMVALVERMLKLHQDLHEAWADNDRDAINRNIEATDNEIDAIVYGLYGLTKDEIAIVEGQTK